MLAGGRPIARHLGKGDVIDAPTLDKYIQALLKVAGINSTRVVLKCTLSLPSFFYFILFLLSSSSFINLFIWFAAAEQSLENGDIAGARQVYAEILHNKQLKVCYFNIKLLLFNNIDNITVRSSGISRIGDVCHQR